MCGKTRSLALEYIVKNLNIRPSGYPHNRRYPTSKDHAETILHELGHFVAQGIEPKDFAPNMVVLDNSDVSDFVSDQLEIDAAYITLLTLYELKMVEPEYENDVARKAAEALNAVYSTEMVLADFDKRARLHHTKYISKAKALSAWFRGIEQTKPWKNADNA